ncbi:hypothetical protein FE257_000533 [Aspergillus nanangensis]|uniref:Major facilitator superfamily (MFS) profile domain-containing protein n=1 Tax=Aspergillus nanangensis TaxID=2582783 RepID=A0AAD4CUT3_ASPNN|nr:hypothetical protein FE257_000533 [Aspergillus nanangensis]
MTGDMNETTPLNPSERETSYQSASTSTLPEGNRSDEENTFLPKVKSTAELAQPVTSVITIVAVLLLGEFISNADGTLVMASAGKISSEFRQLQHASWLSTAYTLGVCTAQPMYGKLSDIYGRKPLLLAAYALFGIGSVISGVGPGLWAVISGRAISGIGGAGIMTMGSVIITGELEITLQDPLHTKNVTNDEYY